MIDRPLRLGTRRSPLAMAQAEEARDRLCAAHPGLAVEILRNLCREMAVRLRYSNSELRALHES